MSHESAKILESVVEHAKKHNIPVAINPGVSQLCNKEMPAYGAKELKKALKNIDVLIMNSSEARTFMGALVETDEKYKKSLTSKEPMPSTDKNGPALLMSPIFHENLYFSISNFFREVMKMGPKVVVVTDGARGVYVATENKILFHPSLKINVVDSLGAGDSFGSCFVGLLQKGFSIENSLRGGIVNSASVIRHIGAKPGLLNFVDIEKQIKNINEDMIKRYEL